MADERVVHIHMAVRVLDEDVLLKYANDHAVDWGYDEGHTFDVPTAIYESLVNNTPPDGPLGVGVEIIDAEAT